MGKKKKPSKDKPPASSKEAIHVLASDVAHLSINEPSTSTLSHPTSTPALARIPSARDLSDDRHQALDAAILRGFQLNVQFNQQPHLAFLLSVIVNNDDRLGHLSQEEAEGLLEREPSLVAVLEQAWNDQSFKELRRLQLLWSDKTSVLPSAHKSTPHEISAIKGAWDTHFQGDGAVRFRMGLDEMNRERGEKLYANFVPIIQSSGMGKSKLVDETAKLIFTLPFCVRSESDGYPMADVVPRQFFKIQAHETFELFFDRCLLFFEKLFNAVTAEIQKLKVKKSQSLPRRWYNHLRENDNRERIYATADATTRVCLNSDRVRHYPSKHTRTGSKTDTDNPKETARPVFIAAKALIDTIRSYAKEADLHDKRLWLLVYIDESHEMTTHEQMLKDDGRNAYQTLCSSLNELLKLDLFFVFLSTNSNMREYSPPGRTFWSKRGQNITLSYIQTPYTELPFDVWKEPHLVSEGAHTLDDVCSVEFMVRFGRPLWWALWEAGDKVVRDGIIQLAMVKLAARNVGKYEANSLLAALSVRLMLDFEPRRTSATEVENLMVAGHLRIANVIPAHREYVISSTPSEPVVAEAAAQVLCSQNMVDLLAQNVREGLIDKGQRGELVARLLLTLAHDQALADIKIPHRANQGQLEKLYTSPIPVTTFFRALFHDQYTDTLMKCHPDNDNKGPTFEDAFADAYVSFTHFSKAADDWCMSHTFMFMALCRHMAISCRERMQFADLCIPIHFGRETLLSRQATSSILVSVKDKVDAMSYNRTSVDVNKMAFAEGGIGRPFIILVLQLSVQAKGSYIPIQRTEIQRDAGLFSTPKRPGRGGEVEPETPIGFTVLRPGTTENTGTTTRGMEVNQGPACYTIDVRGCSSKIFKVVKSAEEPLFSDLLASRYFLSEHSRQDSAHLRAVLAQKPIWTRGPECCSWAALTAGPPDSPVPETVVNNIIFGIEGE